MRVWLVMYLGFYGLGPKRLTIQPAQKKYQSAPLNIPDSLYVRDTIYMYLTFLQSKL